MQLRNQHVKRKRCLPHRIIRNYEREMGVRGEERKIRTFFVVSAIALDVGTTLLLLWILIVLSNIFINGV